MQASDTMLPRDRCCSGRRLMSTIEARREPQRAGLRADVAVRGADSERKAEGRVNLPHTAAFRIARARSGG